MSAVDSVIDVDFLVTEQQQKEEESGILGVRICDDVNDNDGGDNEEKPALVLTPTVDKCKYILM